MDSAGSNAGTYRVQLTSGRTRYRQRARSQSMPTSSLNRTPQEGGSEQRYNSCSSRAKSNEAKLRYKRRKQGKGDAPPKVRNVDSIWKAVQQLSLEDLTVDGLRAILSSPSFKSLPDVQHKFNDKTFWRSNVYRMLREERKARKKGLSAWTPSSCGYFSEMMSSVLSPSASDIDSKDADCDVESNYGTLTEELDVPVINTACHTVDSKFGYPRGMIEERLDLTLESVLGDPKNNIYQVFISKEVVRQARLARQTTHSTLNLEKWSWKASMADGGVSVKVNEDVWLYPLSRREVAERNNWSIPWEQALKVYHNVETARKAIEIMRMFDYNYFFPQVVSTLLLPTRGFVVMERLRRNLGTFLERFFARVDEAPVLDWNFILEVFLLLAIAIRDLHAAGVSYQGDFSAKDVMLTDSNFPVLVGLSKCSLWSCYDMGLNARASASQTLSRKEAQAADMRALGRLLFYMVTGHYYENHTSFLSYSHKLPEYARQLCSVLLMTDHKQMPFSAADLLRMPQLQECYDFLADLENNRRSNWRVGFPCIDRSGYSTTLTADVETFQFNGVGQQIPAAADDDHFML